MKHDREGNGIGNPWFLHGVVESGEGGWVDGGGGVPISFVPLGRTSAILQILARGPPLPPTSIVKQDLRPRCYPFLPYWPYEIFSQGMALLGFLVCLPHVREERYVS